MSLKEVKQNFMDMIIAEREYQHLTATQLSHLMNVHPAHLSNLTHLDKGITLATMVKMANALGKKLKITLE